MFPAVIRKLVIHGPSSACIFYNWQFYTMCLMISVDKEHHDLHEMAKIQQSDHSQNTSRKYKSEK
jgi:hypothetical protein